MSTNQDILNLLEKYQLKDDFLAEKYENISAQKRALIKTAIAFQFSFHKTKHEEEQYFSNKNSGFFYGIHKKPTPFLVCVIEQNFASPAILLSVLCPAVIAGIENIYIFLSSNTADSVLASLELSGMENIYILENNSNMADAVKNINVLSTCLSHLTKDFPHEKGRVVLFSDTSKHDAAEHNKIKNTKIEHDFSTQLQEKTKTLAIPTHIDTHNPSIYVKKENCELINFAYTCPHIINHADKTARNAHESDHQNSNLAANMHVAGTINATDTFAALRNHASTSFTPNNQPVADISFIPELLGIQNYGDGMELCYIHHTINMDFFLNQRISAQMPI